MPFVLEGFNLPLLVFADFLARVCNCDFAISCTLRDVAGGVDVDLGAKLTQIRLAFCNREHKI